MILHLLFACSNADAYAQPALLYLVCMNPLTFPLHTHSHEKASSRKSTTPNELRCIQDFISKCLQE